MPLQTRMVSLEVSIYSELNHATFDTRSNMHLDSPLGNSTKATSGINGAGTRTQQEQGVKDSVKAFFEDTKKSAKDLARDDLIQVLTGNSADAVHWLQDKFKLDLSVLGRLGGHSYQRWVHICHSHQSIYALLNCCSL